MVNILVAIKLFAGAWARKHILFRCDNQAVVQVLSTSRTRNPFLAACARNVWQLAAIGGIDLTYVHVLGRNNQVADLLSRWNHTHQNVVQLLQHVPDPTWVSVSLDLIDLDNTI